MEQETKATEDHIAKNGEKGKGNKMSDEKARKLEWETKIIVMDFDVEPEEVNDNYY